MGKEKNKLPDSKTKKLPQFMADKMCEDFTWKFGMAVKANAVELVLRYNCFASLSIQKQCSATS